MIHNFDDSLKKSHASEELQFWTDLYNKAFRNNFGIHNHRADGEHQRKGIDRSVILDNGKTIWVDEKSRYRADTGDIMLEYVSADNKNTPGWVEKPLLCDYIAYAFIPSRKAYLLPVQQLQYSWQDHKQDWIGKYGTLKAKNKNYNTLNCPVPIDVLFPAIGGMLRVEV